MEVSKVKWDTEILSNDVKALEDQHDELVQRIKRLKHIRDVIGPAWNSPAGRDFTEGLRIHIGRLEDIAGHVKKHNDLLEEGIKEYRDAEKDILAALGRRGLRGSGGGGGGGGGF